MLDGGLALLVSSTPLQLSLHRRFNSPASCCLPCTCLALAAFNHILTDVSLVVYQFEAIAGFSGGWVGGQVAAFVCLCDRQQQWPPLSLAAQPFPAQLDWRGLAPSCLLLAYTCIDIAAGLPLPPFPLLQL